MEIKELFPHKFKLCLKMFSIYFCLAHLPHLRQEQFMLEFCQKRLKYTAAATRKSTNTHTESTTQSVKLKLSKPENLGCLVFMWVPKFGLISMWLHHTLLASGANATTVTAVTSTVQPIRVFFSFSFVCFYSIYSKHMWTIHKSNT